MGTTLLAATAILALALADVAARPPIDRRALVTRHNPTLHRLDPESP